MSVASSVSEVLGSLSLPLVAKYTTNPGNRRGDNAVKDVGRVLLGLAIYRSRLAGFEGRLWLESLPGAELFYDRAVLR